MKRINQIMAEAKSSKDVRFEALRVMACFLVVLSHVAEQGEAVYSVPSSSFMIDDWQIYNIWNCFSRSGAPLFFMISGAFMLDASRDINISRQFKKLFIKLVSWLAFYSLVFYLVYNLIFHPYVITVSGFFKASLLLPSHIWFVWCLLSMYLITPFLRLITVDKNLTWYFLGLGVLVNFVIYQVGGALNSDLYGRVFNKMDFSFVYGMSFYYVAGYALKRFVDVLNAKKKHIVIFTSAAVFCLSWLIAVYISWKLNIQNEPYVFVKTVYNDGFFTTGLESIALFMLFSSIDFNAMRNKKWILFLASYTVGIYYIHYGLMFKIRERGILPLEHMKSCGFIISWFCSAFFGSMIITFVMKRIPIIKRMC